MSDDILINLVSISIGLNILLIILTLKYYSHYRLMDKLFYSVLKDFKDFRNICISILAKNNQDNHD